MNMRASGARKLRKCSDFHIKKLLFPSIFCWYFGYTLSRNIYIFQGVDPFFGLEGGGGGVRKISKFSRAAKLKIVYV